MQEFAGRTAVITGGASGIGLGMARSFAKRGMQIVLADLNEELLHAAEQELLDAGIAVVSQICDASKLDHVERLAQTAMDRFGAVHVVCSNAGVGIPTSARNVKLSDWEWIINVDLWGPIYAVKTFLPLIEAQGEGHINATSSMAGLISSQMMGAYNIAKHGVVALMAATERELRAKQSNVRASVLCPGLYQHKYQSAFGQLSPRPGQAQNDNEKAGKLAGNIQSALEQGMHPDEVGELVASAITEEKFWILTHPRWARAVQKQLDAMVDGQTLTRA